MFQKETAILLKEVKQFPMDKEDAVLESLIASCEAIGDQVKKGKLLNNSEGQRIVNSLIALHLRIVSCAGGVALHNPGSYLPEMSVGHRHRLPPKGKLAGSPMELLLYSRLLAGAALRPYVSAAPVWDFTGVEATDLGQGDDHPYVIAAPERIKDDDDHRTGEEKAENDDPREMSVEELVRMFQSETAILLKDVKRFPMDDDETVLDSLVASCEAIGDEIKKGKILASRPEGQRIVNTLIALHLRIVSCVGTVELLKPGSYLPDMWAGNRHRLPRKAKRAGTMMEVLLYSRMLAGAALAPYVSPPVWDFTGVEDAGSEVEEAD
ncbi:unnamed protein product [Alopecurus aequalis]